MNSVLFWAPAALFALAFVFHVARSPRWGLAFSAAATALAIGSDLVRHNRTGLYGDAVLVVLLAISFFLVRKVRRA